MNKCEKSSWPSHSCNFGLSYQPQPSSANSVNMNVLSRNHVTGACRGSVCISIPPYASTNTFPSHVYPLYDKFFLPVFKKKRKFGNNVVRQHPRMRESFKNRKYLRLPSPLNASIPPKCDTAAVELTHFENEIRTISEWILLNVFLPLPYSQVPKITSDNMVYTTNCSMDKKNI